MSIVPFQEGPEIQRRTWATECRRKLRGAGDGDIAVAVVTGAGEPARMAVQLCDNFRKRVGIPDFAVDGK